MAWRAFGRHADPVQLPLEGALAGRALLLLLGQTGRLLLQPRRVVPLEREAPAPVQLEDPARRVVEEVAVVGHGDDGAVVVLQEPLQPVHALGVEVVRRLVEEQEVRPGQQQAAERHAPPLAARERGDVGVVGRAPERVHGDLDVAVEVPRVCGGDLVLQLGLQRADLLVVRVRVAPHGHDLVVAGQHVADRADAVHHVAEDVLGRVELGSWARHADREPGGEAGLARVAVVLAGHDPQQAGLARAVRADHADLGARVEREGDVGQDRAVRRVEAAELVAGVDELRRHRSGRAYRAAARGGPCNGHGTPRDRASGSVPGSPDPRCYVPASSTDRR